MDSLPAGVLSQVVVFDDEPRSTSHLYTKRASVFLAQSGFRDSAVAIKHFWHYFDSIRTRYTPLYDAISAAITNIEQRRLELADTDRSDVILAVTDGDDNASRLDIETLYDVVRTGDVRLFTLNFRSDIDPRLDWLARHTHGEAYAADDISDLRLFLHDFARSLTSMYHISYRFPSLSPSPSGH